MENEQKLDLTDTPKSNYKFAFPLLNKYELIVKKEVALLKGKNIVAKANVTEKKTCFYLEYLLGQKKMGTCGWPQKIKWFCGVQPS